MSLYFRKGLCPLLLPSEPPTPVPGTSLTAAGRRPPCFLEPPWDRGLGPLPPLSEAPPPSEPSAPCLPRLEPPSDLKTPSLHTNSKPPSSQAPKAPAPPAPVLLCPAHCPGSRCGGWAGRGLRAGGWSPPAAPRSLGNAGKPRAMLALRARTQTRRCSPGGATAREGGLRPQADLAVPCWREVSGREPWEIFSLRSPPNPFTIPPSPSDPTMEAGHTRFHEPPTTSPLDSAAKPTPPLGKPAREHLRSGSGAGPRVGAPAPHSPQRGPIALLSLFFHLYNGQVAGPTGWIVLWIPRLPRGRVQTWAAAYQPRNWPDTSLLWALLSSSVKRGLQRDVLPETLKGEGHIPAVAVTFSLYVTFTVISLFVGVFMRLRRLCVWVGVIFPAPSRPPGLGVRGWGGCVWDWSSCGLRDPPHCSLLHLDHVDHPEPLKWEDPPTPDLSE